MNNMLDSSELRQIYGDYSFYIQWYTHDFKYPYIFGQEKFTDPYHRLVYLDEVLQIYKKMIEKL